MAVSTGVPGRMAIWEEMTAGVAGSSDVGAVSEDGRDTGADGVAAQAVNSSINNKKTIFLILEFLFRCVFSPWCLTGADSRLLYNIFCPGASLLLIK
jgi:hypothetical protein